MAVENAADRAAVLGAVQGEEAVLAGKAADRAVTEVVIAAEIAETGAAIAAAGNVGLRGHPRSTSRSLSTIPCTSTIRLTP